jgi:hypothetical protein
MVNMVMERPIIEITDCHKASHMISNNKMIVNKLP